MRAPDGRRLLGLIGKPVRHSVSPAFQQAALDALGIEATYVVREVEPADLGGFLTGVRGPEWLGVNVTVPYKQAVLSHLDRVDERARLIGAVNTIVRRDNGLDGYNTDADGLVGALADSGFAVAGADVVVLGAGGAGRAAAFGLAWAGARSLLILNRDLERARRLAAEVGSAVPSARVDAGALVPTPADEVRGADLLVNTTSIGMLHGPAEGSSPIDPGAIPAAGLVYDLVYNPPTTPLLAAAAARGARTLGGLPMLVHQGAAAFELWTGREAPRQLMHEAARRALFGD